MTGEVAQIEPLRDAGDLDAILEIDAVSFPTPWTRAMYEREIEAPDRSFILVARTPSRRVAGYCACWVVTDELHIHNVAVHPAARRGGLGRLLVEAALETGRQRGATRAWLEVRSMNHAARLLYRGMGFSEHGRRPGYYAAPPDDAIVMTAQIQLFGMNPAS